MLLKSVVVFVCLFLVTNSVSQAEVRAVLVGVSDYTESSEIPDLQGPKNDVILMRDILAKRGADDVTILAHGVENAGEPTRQAILDALSEVSLRAGPDDLVYIHLSGHGTRQPDEGNDETDGLDEVFLPADTGKVQGETNRIQNALTDDEIGKSVQAIRLTGADVWLVMDSCHSGSGLRATSQVSAVRNVDPQALGVDLSRVSASGPSTLNETSLETKEGMGRYIAFYATKSNDVAREVRVDPGADGEKSDWYGLFTSALAAQLDGAQSPTYRQVFQSVLSRLNRGAGFGAAVIQTPIWEGDLIDEPVLGGTHSGGVRRYLLNGDELDAGLVHGLPVGTLMALVGDVTDPPEAVLGYAQIEEAEARRAFLRPVSGNCQPESNHLCAREGELPEEAKAAQLELHPRDRTIVFSPVLHWQDGAELTEDVATSNLVSQAMNDAAEIVGVTIGRSANNYQVQIALKTGSLWFAADTKLGSEPVGLEFKLGGEDEEKRLQAYFVRILKAELFAQTLENLDEGNAFLNPSPVDIEAEYFSTNLSDLTKPGTALDVRKECRRALAKARPGSFAILEDGTDLKQCDLLQFSAKGAREGQRDVNRIHIDAQYCINVAYELVEGTSEPRRIGGPMVMCSDCPGANAYSAGRERLYFLVSELHDNKEALNLTGLVENCSAYSDGAANNRSAEASDLQSTLAKLGEQGATRGNMSSGFGLSDVWSQSLRWRILPRKEAFARSDSE
ncbi:caspase family protein [Roseibium sp. SCP14]|uniref:caspase family protein n=1 Tax=Roseibium sp. SCP14 TaxID=3141375 RepID=UPI0033372905